MTYKLTGVCLLLVAFILGCGGPSQNTNTGSQKDGVAPPLKAGKGKEMPSGPPPIPKLP